MLALMLMLAAVAPPPPPPADRLHAAGVLLALEGDHGQTVRRLVESVLDELRGPEGDGSYRWAGWAPGGGTPVRKEARVRAVDGSEGERLVLQAEHGSRIVVAVEKRRSLFSGNYPATVHSVVWRCAAWRREETALGSPRRLARGDELSFDLADVCPVLEVEVRATVEEQHRGDSELAVEIETGHVEDDRASPHHEEARRLARFLAETVSSPDERWSRELLDAAREVGRRPPRLRFELERIRRLLDGSERDHRHGVELLDELISGLP